MELENKDNVAGSNDQKKIIDPDVQENKMVAALSYVFVLFLIPLLSKKESKFSQFHAKQGMMLFIVELVAGLFSWFPFFGQLVMLLLLIIAIIAILKAYNGEWWKIPFIYEWSKKINV